MHIWNVRHSACWKYRTQKIAILSQSHNCRAVSSQLMHVSTVGKKNLLDTNTSSTCRHNMVNCGLLTAEIRWRVWGTPANFNKFRVLAALLHGKLCDVEQRAPPIFGRAAITLGIVPHSSLVCILLYCWNPAQPAPMNQFWRLKTKFHYGIQLANQLANQLASGFASWIAYRIWP